MAELKLEHLYKTYGKTQVINDVSFEIDKKSFIVLAGPSGCGKTTLLEMIAGLTKCDHGSISIDGDCMDEVKPEKRELAMVFQNAALFDHMSVYENIAIGLTYSGVAKEQVDALVHAYARMARIEDLLNRKAKTLSGGQKQRVSIARALIRKPKLVLMDEALNALDARLKTQLRIEIAQLYQQTDTTFFYVTHDQVEAMTLAELLIVMKDGSFQQIGKPMEIYQNPRNIFVANFVGKFEINQFTTCIQQQKINCYGLWYTFKDDVKDQDIIVGVRPEHIVYREDEEGCVGYIVLIEHLGDEIFYHISFEDTTLVMKGDLHHQCKMHEQLHFTFSFEHALYFDVQSKERLYLK